jgi:hypothetical protein
MKIQRKAAPIQMRIRCKLQRPPTTERQVAVPHQTQVLLPIRRLHPSIPCLFIKHARRITISRIKSDAYFMANVVIGKTTSAVLLRSVDRKRKQTDRQRTVKILCCHLKLLAWPYFALWLRLINGVGSGGFFVKHSGPSQTSLYGEQHVQSGLSQFLQK